jgi:hypothetical protein
MLLHTPESPYWFWYNLIRARKQLASAPWAFGYVDLRIYCTKITRTNDQTRRRLQKPRRVRVKRHGTAVVHQAQAQGGFR